MNGQFNARWARWLAIAWCLAGAPSAVAQFRPQVPVEEPPLLDARNILPVQTMVSEFWQVDPRVPVVGNHYLFTIHTRWGVPIRAVGMNMLELRLREVLALAHAQLLADDPQLVSKAVQQLRQADPDDNLPEIDPLGGSLRPPKEFERMILGRGHLADDAAGSPVRRQAAIALGVDPQTTNPLLALVLDELARLPRIDVDQQVLQVELPGMTLLSPLPLELDPDRAPSQIDAQVADHLQRLGVPGLLARQYNEQAAYPTLQRLAFARYFEELRQVEGRAGLVERAALAETTFEGLDRLQELRMLADLNANRPLRQVRDIGFPLAVANDGRHYLTMSKDFLYSTATLQEALAAYRQQFPYPQTVLVTSGGISPGAREVLRRHAIDVLDYMREGFQWRIRLRTPNLVELPDE